MTVNVGDKFTSMNYEGSESEVSWENFEYFKNFDFY